MRILLIVILLSFMTGCLSSFKVTGYSGGTVIIYCAYSHQQDDNQTSFSDGNSKDTIITGLKNSWHHVGRFSLYDNTEGNYFKVIIRQLTKQDEGTYRCGVDKPTARDSYTVVELKVEEDDCCEKSVTETVYLGGEATISCNYPEDREDSTKHFCKEQDRFICNSMNSNNNKMYDNSTEKFYSVTISDLTEDDTGTYWCGVETSRTEDRYIALITQVKLRVITTTTTKRTTPATASPAPPTTTFISPSSSSSSSSSPSSPSSSQSSSPSSSSPTSLNRSGTSVVIMVSVSLVVLLLVISLIIVYRWKYNKATGSVSSTHRVSPDKGNNEGGCHGDGDYEEIKERPLQSDSDAAPTTIYATANLPTSHSDSPHYASINFHKNPSGPNEARVTITKEGSCRNEATIAIDKEGTSSCDYATVNFGQSPAYSTVNHPHSSSETPPIYSTVGKPTHT
ncbi:CMRF35-like molecule 8 isoform X2 [Coregonus clupeaformis]|uniref:CMRF35-like molecule 8 isoform X2 n=1 Tax=Coregonus clupeaformis TaxID=59861 RepID=UPI001E1C7911|nr:CMRF35-like molecule 8 isoform X2 [Coregonus clupeaformis]